MGSSLGGGNCSRRELLRRSAVVGGALVWAVPAVQVVPRAAFAAEGSPAPTGKEISYVALVVGSKAVKTVSYRVKYEDGLGWEESPGKTPNCDPPQGWDDATPANGGTLGITIDTSQPDTWVVTIPSTLTFKSAKGAVLKSGQTCELPTTVHGGSGTQSTTTVVFTTSD